MQKVAIGRSMIMKPRIFLLDEPLSNLDAAFRAYMRAELKRLQRNLKQTMVYVTHDQVEAMSMADKIAVMYCGELYQYGSPDEVYDFPVNTFVARFIGSPNMNLVKTEYVVENGMAYLEHPGDGGRIPVDPQRRHAIEARPDGGTLVFGARPERMRLDATPKEDSFWHGAVWAIEPLGPKTVVHVRVGEDVVQVVAPPSYRPRIGDTQHIAFEMDRVHVFDGKSKLALR
jgi:ABC-type sugar transport system ATPase subunit